MRLFGAESLESLPLAGQRQTIRRSPTNEWVKRLEENPLRPAEMARLPKNGNHFFQFRARAQNDTIRCGMPGHVRSLYDRLRSRSKKNSRHFRPAFSQSTDCTFRCVCPLSGSYEIFPFYYDSASCVATLGRKANIWISRQPATLECLKTFLRSVNKNLEGNIWWPDAPISTFFKRNSMYRLNCYFGGLFGLLSFYRFSQWPA